MNINSFEDYDLWVGPLWNDSNIFKQYYPNKKDEKNNIRKLQPDDRKKCK